MTAQLTKTFVLFLCITLTTSILSCNFFKGGNDYYQSGLKEFNSTNFVKSDAYGYDDLEKLKIAINDFEKSIEMGYHQRDVFDNLTWCYWYLNQDNTNMERVYSLGLKSFPNDVEFYYRRGNCRERLNKYKEAFEDFNKAILLDTTRKYEYISDAFYERGAMRYILGDKVNANNDREIAQKSTKDELKTYKVYCQRWK